MDRCKKISIAVVVYRMYKFIIFILKSYTESYQISNGSEAVCDSHITAILKPWSCIQGHCHPGDRRVVLY